MELTDRSSQRPFGGHATSSGKSRVRCRGGALGAVGCALLLAASGCADSGARGDATGDAVADSGGPPLPAKPAFVLDPPDLTTSVVSVQVRLLVKYLRGPLPKELKTAVTGALQLQTYPEGKRVAAEIQVSEQQGRPGDGNVASFAVKPEGGFTKRWYQLVFDVPAGRFSNPASGRQRARFHVGPYLLFSELSLCQLDPGGPVTVELFFSERLSKPAAPEKLIEVRQDKPLRCLVLTKGGGMSLGWACLGVTAGQDITVSVASGVVSQTGSRPALTLGGKTTFVQKVAWSKRPPNKQCVKVLPGS